MAKELASIDVVSNGRLIVGVGRLRARGVRSGGVPLAERNGRMNDYIGALRALWGVGRPHYQGDFVSIDGIDAHPRPVQRPGPPIVVGGESRTALRRAVTTADGWYGFYLDLPTTRRAIGALRRLSVDHERPAHLGRLEITVTPSGSLDRGTVEQYEALGVDRLVLLPQPDAAADERHRPVPLDRIKRNVEAVAHELL